MNILRPQRPYTFYPPCYTPFVVGPLVKWFSSAIMLRRVFHLRSATVTGGERLAQLVRRGETVLVTPNHADHPDPHLLVHASRALGITFHFMAAREGFENGRLARLALRHAGAFSVDREGADVAAIKMAMKILDQARYPLVIFPEGEIYHHHEVLDVLNEGTVTIFLRAADRLLKTGRDAWVVPTAIRYRFGEDIRLTFCSRLDQLERRITWKPRPDMDLVDRVYRLGEGLLALKETEFLGAPRSGELPERIQFLSGRVIAQVEEAYGSAGQPGTVPERAKRLRGMIRKRLTDEQNPVQTAAEARVLYDQLDRIFVAIQLYSYPGRYLRENPSTDRMAETILKLEEDLLGKGRYPGPCDARLIFGEPVSARAYLERTGLGAREAVPRLTEDLGTLIQELLRDA